METPNQIPRDSTKIDVLINQYYNAIDLYKHEDSLNWSKLNHLMYVTGGFGAVFGFFLKNDISDLTKYLDPLILIALIGVVASFSFFIAINSGVRYLQLRKKAVINLDEKLKEIGGFSVMFPDPKNKKGIDRRSPTTFVLRAFPVFILCLWIVILLARIF